MMYELGYAMLCYVALCLAMLRYVTLCYAMLCVASRNVSLLLPCFAHVTEGKAKAGTRYGAKPHGLVKFLCFAMLCYALLCFP